MKREQAKTITLTLLTVISIILTWNIWTFQPNYEYIPRSEYLETQGLSEPGKTKLISDVIKPQQIFYHNDKKHLGTFNPITINKAWSLMMGWNIEGSKVVTDEHKGNFLNWLQGEDGERKAEFVLPDEIHTDTLQAIFSKWKQQKYPSSFDRIMIPLKDSYNSKRQSPIYFVSYQNQLVVEAEVSESEIQQLDKQVFGPLSSFEPYEAEKISPSLMLMLPKQSLNLKHYTYDTASYQPDTFKQVMFDNPNSPNTPVISQQRESGMIEYTDTSHFLEVSPSERKMTFRRTTAPALSPDAPQLIQQSIDFLNNHRGWTDNYMFFRMNNAENSAVSFRMKLKNGVPVFTSEENPFGPTDIVEEWGSSDIARYVRPTYRLKSEVNNSDQSIMSGSELMKDLKKRPDLYNPRTVKNIFPGYEMSASDRSQMVNIDPAWFIETKDGRIKAIHFDNRVIRGKANGLE